jgi:hypothetical protein
MEFPVQDMTVPSGETRARRMKWDSYGGCHGGR